MKALQRAVGFHRRPGVVRPQGFVFDAKFDLRILGGPFLAGFILRSACDLVGVDPSPSYRRCVLVAVLLALVGGPVIAGVALGHKALSIAMQLPDAFAIAAAILVGVALSAIVCTVTYVLAFRVRLLKGASVWLVDSLMRSLLGGVAALLIVGIWTTVEAVRRLI